MTLVDVTELFAERHEMFNRLPESRIVKWTARPAGGAAYGRGEVRCGCRTLWFLRVRIFSWVGAFFQGIALDQTAFRFGIVRPTAPWPILACLPTGYSA